MFTTPPRGHHSPAAVVHTVPGRIIAAVGLGAVALTVVFSAVLLGVVTQSPVVGGVNGVIAALMAINVARSRYAAGPDWLRNGASHVNLTDLTSAELRKDHLVLTDSRQDGGLWTRWMSDGRVSIPLTVLHAAPALAKLLHTALTKASDQGQLHPAPAVLAQLDTDPATPA